MAKKTPPLGGGGGLRGRTQDWVQFIPQSSFLPHDLWNISPLFFIFSLFQSWLNHKRTNFLSFVQVENVSLRSCFLRVICRTELEPVKHKWPKVRVVSRQRSKPEEFRVSIVGAQRPISCSLLRYLHCRPPQYPPTFMWAGSFISELKQTEHEFDQSPPFIT